MIDVERVIRELPLQDEVIIFNSNSISCSPMSNL
jgi:hypothetical protein